MKKKSRTIILKIKNKIIQFSYRIIRNARIIYFIWLQRPIGSTFSFWCNCESIFKCCFWIFLCMSCSISIINVSCAKIHSPWTVWHNHTHSHYGLLWWDVSGANPTLFFKLLAAIARFQTLRESIKLLLEVTMPFITVHVLLPLWWSRTSVSVLHT